MKILKIVPSLVLLALLLSCSNNSRHQDESGAAHSHEDDGVHMHEEGAVHTHETGDALLNQEDAVNANETGDGHLHEEEALHSHEPVSGSSPEESEVNQHGNTSSDTDHQTLILTRQSFRSITKTSGQILVDKKDEIIITAKSSGIVRFSDHFLYPGLKIKRGTPLFLITGEELTENNSSLKFSKVEADYKEAKANFERATLLITDKLITETAFAKAKSEFEKAEAEFLVYSGTYSNSTSSVLCPAECYLNEVYVTEGEMVSSGKPLASILIEHNMVLRADLPPSDFESIKEIESAKFATNYSKTVFSTMNMHGSKISSGRSSGENSYYIPVYFRMDYNNELIPGTFADIWLEGKEIASVIVIPNRSILEEYGKFYVYIDHDGHFDKRYILPGKTDGELTHVLSGLTEGESIVTEGAYQVKMSMMTSIPNTHDHNH